MASSWLRHGIIYTTWLHALRRTEPNSRRKWPKACSSAPCEPRLLYNRARIALSSIDARNPAYFALLRDIERTITRTRYTSGMKEIRDEGNEVVFFQVRFSRFVIVIYIYIWKSVSFYHCDVQATFIKE